MKHLKLLGVVLFLLLAMLLSSCDCIHKYSEWNTTKAAGCTVDGVREQVCSKCGKVESEVIPKTGHSFGEWIAEGSEGQSRTCAGCGYKEFQYYKDQNQQGNDSNSGQDNVNVGMYSNFDMFLNDCTSGGGNSITYNGAANKLIVSLVAGTYACDNYTIYIPKRVSEITITGRLQGTPFQNVQIIFEERTSDIDVAFENINIESTSTILKSETRNINFNIDFKGEQCSFIVKKAAAGRKGADAEDQLGQAVADHGENGKDGAHAMIVNGNCHVKCFTNLTIKGGDGGDGGNGGSVPKGLPAKGIAGNGGNGGNGGNAFYGEKIAVIEIASQTIVDPSISGGYGGNGGEKGICHKNIGNDGSNGSDGVIGSSGCGEFIYLS